MFGNARGIWVLVELLDNSIVLRSAFSDLNEAKPCSFSCRGSA